MAAVETVRPEGDRVANTTHDLYRQYGRQIYAYCFHKLRSREEAEDAVQTTFMNAFRALQRGTAMQFEQAWLYKIAQNVCFERQSSSSRRRLHEVANDFETLQEVVPARESDEPLELIGIEDALEAMPENQRRAILLREWQGLSYREISDELGLSQAAVEMLIFRARRSLAGALEKPDELRAKRRKVGRGITVGGLLSALKTLFGGGAAIKAVAAAAAAVVVVGESAQYTVVHQPQSHASRGAVSAAKSRLAAAAVASHSTARRVAAAPTVAEPSVVNAPTAAAHAASSARANVATATASAAQSRHAVTGHVGTSAPKADVEPTPPPAPVVAPPAPAPAPVVPAAAAPVPHPEVPAHPVVPAPPVKVAPPKVEKVEKAVTVTTPAPPVTVPAVTLPTLATEPPPPAPADTPGNGNAYGHTKDKGDPPVVTTPDAPVVPAPADNGNGNGNGNGHGKDKGDPQAAPVPAQPTVTTVAAAPDHGNGRGNGNGHGKP